MDHGAISPSLMVLFKIKKKSVNISIPINQICANLKPETPDFQKSTKSTKPIKMYKLGQESFFCTSLSIWIRWLLPKIDCSAAAVQDSEVLLLSQPKPASAVTPTIVVVICGSAGG